MDLHTSDVLTALSKHAINICNDLKERCTIMSQSMIEGKVGQHFPKTCYKTMYTQGEKKVSQSLVKKKS